VVDAVARAERIVLSAVALGELFAGFRGGERERRNRDELERFLSSPRVALAPVDEETAERYGEILVHLRRTGTPIPTNDVWIAATAMQRGLTLHTTDVHFQRVPHVMVRLYSL